MASKPRTAEPLTQETVAQGGHDGTSSPAMADWLAEATAQGIKPEQALALIGLGLIRNIGGAAGGESAWIWSEGEDGGSADLPALRQRLELTDLTVLLGARPGGAVVERGGLRARRISRNVWKLSKAEEGGPSFQDGFRRRL
jgi:hypothetical protein